MKCFSIEKRVPMADDRGSSREGVQQVVNAINRFSFELYAELNRTEKDNIFCSPYSITSAFALIYEGAKENTAKELKSVFHFPGTKILRPNFAAIYNATNRISKEYDIKTGNVLWIQQDYPLLPDYKNRIRKYYGGKAVNMDFMGDAEKSRQIINASIKKTTNNKIRDIIPHGAIDEMTKSIITNAIYFKGNWKWEFKKSNTCDEDFKISESKKVKTEMMKMYPAEARFMYADLEKIQLLELPYKGNNISMLIILPNQGEKKYIDGKMDGKTLVIPHNQLKDYRDGGTGNPVVSNYILDDIELTDQKLAEYKSYMRETELEKIWLPKFKFDTAYFLSETLKKMGIREAFNPAADLTRMAGTNDLQIGPTIHKAFIQVDEQGTEAAAATAMIQPIISGIPKIRPKLPTFKADHPFLFLIQDLKTGTILFIGKVMDPTQ